MPNVIQDTREILESCSLLDLLYKLAVFIGKAVFARPSVPNRNTMRSNTKYWTAVYTCDCSATAKKRGVERADSGPFAPIRNF